MLSQPGSPVPQSLISKARHALGLKKLRPHNDQVCTPTVWEQLVDSIGSTMNCTPETIQRAKSRYCHYMDVWTD